MHSYSLRYALMASFVALGTCVLEPDGVTCPSPMNGGLSSWLQDVRANSSGISPAELSLQSDYAVAYIGSSKVVTMQSSFDVYTASNAVEWYSGNGSFVRLPDRNISVPMSLGAVSVGNNLMLFMPNNILVVYNLVQIAFINMTSGNVTMGSGMGGTGIARYDNNTVVLGMGGGGIQFYDVRTGQLVAMRTDTAYSSFPSVAVASLAVSPQGDVATGIRIGTAEVPAAIRIWAHPMTNFNQGPTVYPYASNKITSVTSLVYLSNGMLAAAYKTSTQGGPSGVSVWNPNAGTILRTLVVNTDAVAEIFELKAGVLASLSSTGTVQLWKIESGELIQNLNFPFVVKSILPGPGLTVIAFSNDHNVPGLWVIKPLLVQTSPAGWLLLPGTNDLMPCPAGQVCSLCNATVGKPCLLGEYCPPGSAYSNKCPAGNYCPDTTQALPCDFAARCPPGSTAQVLERLNVYVPIIVTSCIALVAALVMVVIKVRHTRKMKEEAEKGVQPAQTVTVDAPPPAQTKGRRWKFIAMETIKNAEQRLARWMQWYSMIFLLVDVGTDVWNWVVMEQSTCAHAPQTFADVYSPSAYDDWVASWGHCHYNCEASGCTLSGTDGERDDLEMAVSKVFLGILVIILVKELFKSVAFLVMLLNDSTRNSRKLPYVAINPLTPLFAMCCGGNAFLDVVFANAENDNVKLMVIDCFIEDIPELYVVIHYMSLMNQPPGWSTSFSLWSSVWGIVSIVIAAGIKFSKSVRDTREAFKSAAHPAEKGKTEKPEKMDMHTNPTAKPLPRSQSPVAGQKSSIHKETQNTLAATPGVGANTADEPSEVRHLQTEVAELQASVRHLQDELNVIQGQQGRMENEIGELQEEIHHLRDAPGNTEHHTNRHVAVQVAGMQPSDTTHTKS